MQCTLRAATVAIKSAKQHTSLQVVVLLLQLLMLLPLLLMLLPLLLMLQPLMLLLLHQVRRVGSFFFPALLFFDFFRNATFFCLQLGADGP